ncbi:MAG TPA: BON domain-containing protein [Bacteroidota bacterium]|nr:BON domain-containing protein [Bacteroidota bacterium]
MKRVIGPVIVTILFAAFGYAENPNNPSKGHNDAFASGPENESQMAKQIRHDLLMLPYYSIFDDLAFQLDGSTVTLEGACPPEPPWDIKSDAENAAKRVKGVTKVVDNIKVLPLSPMDWQIRRAVARAIYGNPEIGPRYGYQALPSIHIIVDNGHVTLEGVVDDQFDDQLVRTLANQVPYVFSVTDDLTVLNKGKQKKGAS